MRLWRLVLLCLACTQFACSNSETTRKISVAVATNFYETAEEIAKLYEKQHGIEVVLVSGSSGKLFAQIRNGAPFDVFLSADERRAEALEAAGYAEQGSGFVYALGRLTLWSSDPERITRDGASVLRTANFNRIAIANPALAPYGQAAREVLLALGVLELLEARIVMGENVAQAYAMVATGNAELGIVSRAAMVSPSHRIPGSRWDVPANLHAPVRQRAVLLRHGETNDGARTFCAFLQSPVATSVIRQAGYDTE